MAAGVCLLPFRLLMPRYGKQWHRPHQVSSGWAACL